MSPDDPRHGDYAGVQAHMAEGSPTCAACAAARTRYQKRMKHRLAHGQRNIVPLGREAHAILTRSPVSTVVELTGLDLNNLHRLGRTGPDAMVLRSTRDAILQARPRWTHVGVQRRVRALMAAGYSARHLSDTLNVDYDGILKLARRQRVQFVKCAYAAAICDLYTLLADQQPEPSASATIARLRARQNGYLPAASWDDIDLDPDLQPLPADFVDEAVVERILAGYPVPATTAERLETIRRWRGSGRSLSELHQLTGWNIYRHLQEAA